MGSDDRDKARGIFDPSDKGQDIMGMLDPGGKIIKRTTGSDIGRSVADPLKVLGAADPRIAIRKAEKAQAEKLKRSRQAEALRLAEAESGIAERKASMLPGRGGRSLLIATSPTGIRAQSLGGG